MPPAMEGGLTIIDIYKSCSINRSHLSNNLLVSAVGNSCYCCSAQHSPWLHSHCILAACNYAWAFAGELGLPKGLEWRLALIELRSI